MTTETGIESPSVRAAALHSLGFLYDTAMGCFYREFRGAEPIILPKDFVTNVGNETFFKEYYRLRKLVQKEESVEDA